MTSKRGPRRARRGDRGAGVVGAVLAATLAVWLHPLGGHCEPGPAAGGGSVLAQATLTLRAAKRFSPRRRWWSCDEATCRHCGHMAEAHHGEERFCTRSAEKLRRQLQFVLRLRAADAFLRRARNTFVGRQADDTGVRLRGGGGGSREGIDYSKWAHLDESSSRSDVRKAAFWDLERRPEDGDFSSGLSDAEPAHRLRAASPEQPAQCSEDPGASAAASVRRPGAGPLLGSSRRRHGAAIPPDDSESSGPCSSSSPVSEVAAGAAWSGAQDGQLREAAMPPRVEGETWAAGLAHKRSRASPPAHAAAQLSGGATGRQHACGAASEEQRPHGNSSVARAGPRVTLANRALEHTTVYKHALACVRALVSTEGRA